MSFREGTEPPREFLTVAETAEIFGLSVSSVKRLIASGALPSIKAGKLRRVRRSVLATWPGVSPTGDAA